jgi:hypothetical protein
VVAHGSTPFLAISANTVGVLRVSRRKQAVNEDVVPPAVGGDPGPEHFVEQIEGAHGEPDACRTRDEGVVGGGVGAHPGLPHSVHHGNARVESRGLAVRDEEGVVMETKAARLRTPAPGIRRLGRPRKREKGC